MTEQLLSKTLKSLIYLRRIAHRVTNARTEVSESASPHCRSLEESVSIPHHLGLQLPMRFSILANVQFSCLPLALRPESKAGREGAVSYERSRNRVSCMAAGNSFLISNAANAKSLTPGESIVLLRQSAEPSVAGIVLCAL